MELLSKLQSLLATQKNSVLKSLCVSCGLSNAGTKAVLASRVSRAVILAELSSPAVPAKTFAANSKDTRTKLSSDGFSFSKSITYQSNNKSFKVLSIDLGIKNFSYCKFKTTLNILTKDTVPIVYDWEKLNVFDYTDGKLDTLILGSENEKSQAEIELSGEDFSEMSDSEDRNEMRNTTIENQYSPNVFAEVAFKLVQKLFTEMEKSTTSNLTGSNSFANAMPFDVILIEEQRSRTKSNAAVQQWTLRVNMLEHMLFATIRSLQQLMPEKFGNMVVFLSSPKRMGNYWTGVQSLETQRSLKENTTANDDNKQCVNGEKEINTKRKKKLLLKNAKKERIALVENWLTEYIYTKLGSHSKGNSNKKSSLNKLLVSSSRTPFTIDTKLWNIIQTNLKETLEFSDLLHDDGKKNVKEGGRTTARKQRLFAIAMAHAHAADDSNLNTNVTAKAKKREKSTTLKSLTKYDDLADSLLHGLSWFSWQKNKLVLSEALIDIVSAEGDIKTQEQAVLAVADDIERRHLEEIT